MARPLASWRAAPINRQMLRLIGLPFTLDIGKGQRELGYRPVVTWEQGLREM